MSSKHRTALALLVVALAVPAIAKSQHKPLEPTLLTRLVLRVVRALDMPNIVWPTP